MSEIQSGFIVDGQIFNTRREAEDFKRRPLIEAALTKLTGGNKDLVKWLMDNEEEVMTSYEVGTVKRVTKAEGKKLKKALDAIVAANNPAFKFVTDNAAAVLASFRWPSVKRLKDEEKAGAIREAFMTLAKDNESLVNFLITNEGDLKLCFEAGKEKRVVAPETMAKLAAARDARHAKMKADKEAKEAAEKAAARDARHAKMKADKGAKEAAEKAAAQQG